MKLKLAAWLAIGVMAISGAALAQSKIVRGEGSITVPTGAFSSGLKPADRAAALQAAKMSAWRSYLALPGQNETVDQVRANEGQFLGKLDDLLVDIVTTDESFDRDSGRYTLRIKATVAESVLNSMLRGIARSGAPNQTVANAGAQGGSAVSGAPIIVLALAREADAIRSFRDKVTDVTERSRDAEFAGVRSSAGGANNKVVKETTISTERTKDVSGGNTERKRDAVTYKMGNASVLNGKLPRILLQNGIKASPYAFMMRPCNLPNPDSFSRQYADSGSGELPSSVMADIQEKLLACGRAKYWVFASMDVGGYGRDPNTGLTLATVSVNVQVYEVETGAPVASASKDVSGRSADQSDAIRIATDNAVQAVGDIITAQIAGVPR
ncbi:hypothetical protein GHT07_04860 [Caenimonas koreensis DSM 17982]|uniref:LPP20 lipoprotein n=1 Tax=Caenimonas koreensis DSM 17982 TaxID=1121255 RepID=A0A844AQX1_9BURK|nr:hypothetical protein [Caenimonas koreensis]MRD46595.1 hypothetical protein [Caenimonas koreensis DSM 17982]